MSEENLLEELNGRHRAINHLGVMGGMPGFANFHRNQIRAIKSELARRWRNQAVAKNRVRKNRKVQARVRMAANIFKERARLFKPATRTSPAGLSAAAAYGAHEPNVSYIEMQRRMRNMLRARRVQTRNASTSMSPSRRSASRSPNAKTRRT